MASDDAQIAQVFAKDHSSTFRKIPMRCAMEPIFANAVLLIVFIRNRIHIGFCRHGLEEGGIEHSHLRSIRHELLACSDASDRCFVVERSELCQLFDLRYDLIVDEGGAIEVFATMHDTVTDRTDLVKRCDDWFVSRKKGIYDEFECFSVIFQRLLDQDLIIVNTMLAESIGRTNTLAQTTRKHLIRIEIDELILERRRSCIDNEGFQRNSFRKPLNNYTF